MRVAVYYSNSDLRIEERPRPELGAGELLMRVCASGICGSDLMEWYRRPRAPLVLGHEVSGLVEEAAPETGFRVGERIVTTHHVPCGTCRLCRSDRHASCPTLHATSFDPGGFSELVRLPRANAERGTFRLPDEISFEEGSFVEPLACVLRAQRVGGVAEGDSVAVLGSGISGILHLQVARARGAGRRFAIDVDPARLALARRYGADLALDAATPDFTATIQAANEGRLPDRVIVCAASVAALRQALTLVAPGGSVLLFAPLPPEEAVSVPMGDLWRRGVALVPSYAGPPDDMRAALQWIASRRVDVASMVTHRVGLDEIGRGFALVARGGTALKVIVDPRR